MTCTNIAFDKDFCTTHDIPSCVAGLKNNQKEVSDLVTAFPAGTHCLGQLKVYMMSGRQAYELNIKIKH